MTRGVAGVGAGIGEGLDAGFTIATILSRLVQQENKLQSIYQPSLPAELITDILVSLENTEPSSSLSTSFWPGEHSLQVQLFSSPSLSIVSHSRCGKKS